MHTSRFFSRLLFSLLMLSSLGCSVTATAQAYQWAPDFPVGSSIPVLEAPDQDGRVQTLETLAGPRGLALFFNRSFDWCPYCKAQLVDLRDQQAALEATGFNVATITYDPVATLKLVEEDLGIGFPLLHDENLKHVNAFNIRNRDYEPGDFAYGIPEPGIMLVSPTGEILAKFAEADYRVRPDLAVVIEAADQL